MGSVKRAVLTGCLIGALVVVAGCSSGGSSTTAKTRPRTTTPTAAKVKSVQVNLALTGSRAAVVAGTAGTCKIPPYGAPTYDFEGSDYPSLGPDGSLSVIGPLVVANGGSVPPTVKIIMGDVGLLSPQNGAGITVSQNKRSVTLDADVSGGPGVTEDNSLLPPNTSLHAHISGTIRCN
jgi:hypothetical protein